MPVFSDQATLGDGVDVVGECQCDDIGSEAVDDGTPLFARATVGLLDAEIVTSFGFPLRGKGFVEILIELTRRIVGDVEQRDLGSNDG